MHAVRYRAFLPGPAGIWEGAWTTLAAAPVTVDDVGAWPHSDGILWVAFFGTLHWPAAGADLGVGGISVAILVLFELWAGERLAFEKAVPQNRRPSVWSTH